MIKGLHKLEFANGTVHVKDVREYIGYNFNPDSGKRSAKIVDIKQSPTGEITYFYQYYMGFTLDGLRPEVLIIKDSRRIEIKSKPKTNAQRLKHKRENSGRYRPMALDTRILRS